MRKQLTLLVFGFIIAALTLGLTYRPSASATVPGTNTLVSVNSTGNGQGGDLGSNGSVLSADGKYVAFTSSATNLVPSDTNAKIDVFVRDLSTSTTTRVNISSSGVQANDYTPDNSIGISRTGRYVVFSSWSTNLIDGQMTRLGEIYIHDMLTDTTSLVTKTSSGAAGQCGTSGNLAVSSDGRFVTFIGGCSDIGPTLPNGNYVNVFDRILGTITVAGVPVSGSASAGSTPDWVSCDGTIAVFYTSSKDTSDDLDSQSDVYVVDLRNGFSIKNISAATTSLTTSAIAPSISCSGDFITFSSNDYTLDPTHVSSTDTNYHTYIYNRINNTYSIADKTASGSVSNGTADALNMPSPVDDNGNVVFYSSSTNLSSSVTNYPYPNPGQLWLRNNLAGTTELISKKSTGEAANYDGAHNPSYKSLSISLTGTIMVYSTNTTNLISSDTNGANDIFTSLTGL